MATKFNKVNGRWEDTCEKHNEIGQQLIDLAKESGCIEIHAYEYGFGNDSCVYTYFLHKSVKYPDSIQLTEFFHDEDSDEYRMCTDEEITSGYDLCGITVLDIEVM